MVFGIGADELKHVLENESIVRLRKAIKFGIPQHKDAPSAIASEIDCKPQCCPGHIIPSLNNLDFFLQPAVGDGADKADFSCLRECEVDPRSAGGFDLDVCRWLNRSQNLSEHGAQVPACCSEA